jgi:hypothetical protein
MSTPANPLDQLLARAREAVRAADAAKVARTKAKDLRQPISARDAAASEYREWAESLLWTLVAKERLVTRWTCHCGSVHQSHIVQFFALYEHRIQANSTREVVCDKRDHPSLPVRMRTLERSTQYCVNCS